MNSSDLFLLENNNNIKKAHKIVIYNYEKKYSKFVEFTKSCDLINIKGIYIKLKYIDYLFDTKINIKYNDVSIYNFPLHFILNMNEIYFNNYLNNEKENENEEKELFIDFQFKFLLNHPFITNSFGNYNLRFDNIENIETITLLLEYTLFNKNKHIEYLTQNKIYNIRTIDTHIIEYKQKNAYNDIDKRLYEYDCSLYFKSYGIILQIPKKELTYVKICLTSGNNNFTLLEYDEMLIDVYISEINKNLIFIGFNLLNDYKSYDEENCINLSKYDKFLIKLKTKNLIDYDLINFDKAPKIMMYVINMNQIQYSSNGFVGLKYCC